MSHSELIRDIDIEISSICNAKCGVCPRYSYGHLIGHKQTYWTLEEFKSIIDVNIIKQLLGISMCGNFGDPMTNPEIVGIVRWIRSYNAKVGIKIHTNGGVGTPQQYKELALLDVKITFGIDGIGSYNNLYRVNVDWNILNENVRMFSKFAFPDQFSIQFLLWKETTNQIIPIIDYAIDVECDELYLRVPYSHIPRTEIFGINGNSLHFLTPLTDPSADFIRETHWKFSELQDLHNKVLDANIPNINLDISNNYMYNRPMISKGQYIPIEFEFNENEKLNNSQKRVCNCYSKNRNNSPSPLYNIFITYDKILMPCCMIPSIIIPHIYNSHGNESGYQREMLNKIMTIGIDKFRLNNRTLRDVFDSGVLHNFIYDDLNNDKSYGLCKLNCGEYKK